MTDLIHLPCGAVCRPISGPEPPDPDRWGNRRVTHECGACGERGTVTHPPHGSRLVPTGFEFSDRVEWLVPLDDAPA